MDEINASDKAVTNSNKKGNIQFKKIIIPLIAVILVLSLATFILNSASQKPISTSPTEETPSPVSQISPNAESILALLPNPLTLDASNNGTMDVNIETGGNEVTAVQIELKYDPSAITNVSIKPSKFFTSPVELLKLIDSKNGRITYMIGISPAQSPVSGSGSVAQITFSKARNTNLESTEIKFTKTENSESIVTATGIEESVLKETVNTTIQLTQN